MKVSGVVLIKKSAIEQREIGKIGKRGSLKMVTLTQIGICRKFENFRRPTNRRRIATL